MMTTAFALHVLIVAFIRPFGFALFYSRGVAPPELTTGNIYQGVIPFILLQLLVVILIVIFPGIVSFLPSLIS